MSLEKIIEKIRVDAQQKADSIIRQAEEDAGKILTRAEQEAKEKANRIIEEATQSAQQKDRRMILAAELACRKDILSEKQKAIRTCFERALEKLNQMPDRQYLEIVKNMLVASASSDFTEVIFPKNDRRRINQSFIDEVNKALKDSGRKGQLQISKEQRDISGGFILKGDRVEIDNSFASVLKYRKSDLEADVARILFKGTFK